MTRRRCILLLAVFIALPFSLGADDSELSRQSLRGVQSFGILVEELDPAAIALGLSVAELQTAAELKLRLAGVKIVSAKDSIKLLGSPYLYVDLSTVGKAPGTIGYNLDLSFQQDVLMVRGSSKSLSAATWSVGRIGLGGSSQAVEGIKNSLSLLLDNFLNAYLSVNPK